MERPIERMSAKDLVYDRLWQMIYDRTLVPGQRIPLDSLIKQWQVSRQPAQMACCWLEAVGLVKVRPQRGTFVREIRREEFMHEFNALFGLEAWGIRQCLEACPHEFTEFVLDACKVVETDSSPETLAMVDVQLHRWIMDNAGNPVMLKLWKQIEAVTRLAAGELRVRQIPIFWSLEQYREMCDAIKQRDMATLSALWKQHIDFHIENLEADPENA